MVSDGPNPVLENSKNKKISKCNFLCKSVTIIIIFSLIPNTHGNKLREKTCSDMVRVTLHLTGLTQSSYHDMNVTCKFFIIRMM